MKNEAILNRDIIIQALVDALKPLDYVHAFWEAGAAAFNRVDEWSDIDLYLVVDDGRIDDAFLAVEKALKRLSPIRQKFEVPHPPRLGLSQAFYKLEGVSKYLLVDLAIFKPDSPNKFLEPEIHGNAIFYFNKSGKIQPPMLDKKVFVAKLEERLKRLKARFDMFNIFIQKEINRGNHLEALDFYHAFVLTPLVEALRTRYNPVHHNFRMHYIHYELPPETIERLKHLYLVKDEKSLQTNYDEATKWFNETISEICKEEIESLVKG